MLLMGAPPPLWMDAPLIWMAAGYIDPLCKYDVVLMNEVAFRNIDSLYRKLYYFNIVSWHEAGVTVKDWE